MQSPQSMEATFKVMALCFDYPCILPLQMTLTIDVNEINSFLMDFAEVISQTNFSIFPLDLKTINNIMTKFFL